MSAVAAIRYLLANNVSLIAAVPAAKIMPGPVPLNTVLPAIGVNEISTVERTAVAIDGADVFTTARVQVTVLAKTYPDQKSILDLVRKACGNTRGTINGVVVDSIISDGAGPDFRDNEAEIYMQSRDFMVKFAAAT